MPYTDADLVQDIAERLGLVGVGQTAEPEDARRIRAQLPGVVADLAARDIFAFATLDTIEDAPFAHLSAVAAGRLARGFGVTSPELDSLQSERQASEQNLRVMRALPYARTPARPAYF